MPPDAVNPIDFIPPGTPVDLDNCAREPIHLPGSVQAHGAVLVARASDGMVVQTSENISEYAAGGADAVLGKTLAELFGADAARRLAEQPTGPGSPTVRPDRMALLGRSVDTHAFAPAEGLLGVDVEPAYEAPSDAIQLIGQVSRWASALQTEHSIDSLATIAAGVLRELTGFDRTWAYRFAPDGHGIVVAEHRRPDLESFLGLHFPEGDIPKQARDLYLRSGVRVIGDTESTDARLVPLENPVTGEWLNLSGSGLRAVSPMHIRYLRNMGVHSSMSVPLVVNGKLWGLLSAHHYDAPHLVPVRVRGECELLGVITSMQLGTVSELQHTTEQLGLQQAVTRVMDHAGTDEQIASSLTSDSEALLAVCAAAGAVIAIGDDLVLVGRTPDRPAVRRLLAALTERTDDLLATASITEEHPDLADLADLTEQASGVLAFPLSRRQGNWIVWLRPESVEEVTWANRDKSLVQHDASGVMELGGRESFERWAETVRGRSTPWTDAEVASVQTLRSALGTLLIARAEQLARLNEELERSNDELDAFAYAAAHDLREPVRGIEQYADFFLEDYGEVLDDTGRAQMNTIIRLAGRMDGLLSSLLQYAEIGESTWTRTSVDLETIVEQVLELLAARIPDGAEITVQPASIDADEAGLRQLLLNLIWNGVKYSGDAPVRIEIGTCSLTEAEGGRTRVRRSVATDREPTTLFVRDHGIGIAPEHHDGIFELFRRLHPKDEYGGGSGAGLTLCRRIVERHGGTIWVDSTPGKGSTFSFTLEAA